MQMSIAYQFSESEFCEKQMDQLMLKHTQKYKRNNRIGIH